MADQVGVINHGRIVLVDEKAALMRKQRAKTDAGALQKPLPTLPKELAGWPLELEDGGRRAPSPIASLRGPRTQRYRAVPRRRNEIGVDFRDLDTSTTALEDIFVDLVGRAT